MKDCSICTHPQLEGINQELLNGISVRKIAEKYGVGRMSLERHKVNHLIVNRDKLSIVTSNRDSLNRDTNIKDNVTACDDIKCDDTVTNRDRVPIDQEVKLSPYQALGGHWKVIEEAGKVPLYFKKRVIPLEPFGTHYYDPKSKEEFKKDGNSWFLRIPYYKGEWVNLDNVACFYEQP